MKTSRCTNVEFARMTNIKFGFNYDHMRGVINSKLNK